MKITPKSGRVTGINLVDRDKRVMEILCIDTKSIRGVRPRDPGVKLLYLDPQEKASAVVIPPEEAKAQTEEGTFLQ